MLLEVKTAVVYGAGGHIGRAVARASARDGVRLPVQRRPPELAARRVDFGAHYSTKK
jgi:NAD(P)-dependent dehydrogenase (short-subunit alcohol dehydrogenase family)